MDRSLIRDMAEERLVNALSYIKHYQEGDAMDALHTFITPKQFSIQDLNMVPKAQELPPPGAEQ